MASLDRKIVPLILATFASVALAQNCPVTTDVATYPNPPLTYPMTSDRYAVQYQLGGSGTWTNAQVYISYYGGANSSPYVNASGYPADESLSFVSIPAAASTAVAVRVTKIFGSNFPALNQMSVRPTAKGIQISSVSPTVVQLSTTTAVGFMGDQFILLWNGTAQASGAIQGLAIFLNPPYTRPTGSNVKVIAATADLASDLSAFDTLDIEGTVAVASTGALAFVVPANINNIFLGPSGWLQGKLRFTQSGIGHTRKIYGPGVLDGSRFNYMNRHCSDTSDHPDDGYQSISWISLPNKINGVPSVPDGFVVDGVIVSDNDYYATAWFNNTTINNMKIIGWNGNNDGIQMGITVRVSNAFIHTGDDSLKMWGSYITVTNATVWQGWNGGVINLGWSDNSPGDDCVIDGVYVVKTDWSLTKTPSWTSTSLNFDNSAIVASLMVPGTSYGGLIPSVFRNIYVEDPPRVLFSLKITPPLTLSPPMVDLSLLSVLNLNIENVFTPASTLGNSIGFQTVNGAPLTGSMNIGLTNILITPKNGAATALTSANAATTGDISTNGSNVNIAYASIPAATTPPVVPSGAVNAAGLASGTPIAPGSIASLRGSGFGSSPAGVTVLVGGIAAPLIGVTPQEITFQVPWQLSGATQTTLTVTSGDLTSAPITVPLASQAPGTFTLNSSGQGAALIANTATVAAPVGTFAGSRPAQQGETISIYCTGLGPVTNQPATGAPAAVNPASLTSSVSVSIGGVPATVSSSGLVTGYLGPAPLSIFGFGAAYLGLYQVNVQVPSNAPIGAAVPLTISIGGSTSNQVSIAVAASSANAVTITAVESAGGFLGIAQNAWIEIQGANLAPASVGAAGMTWSSAPDFASGKMPTGLSNVSVTVNGKAAFVYFISAAQINVLTPLDNTQGPVKVVVTNGTTSSAAFTVNEGAVAPSFVPIAGGNYVVATHANGSLIGPTSLSVPGYPFTPAKAGETIVVYAFGFGLPSTALVNGSAVQSGSLPSLPAILIGGAPAGVVFAGVISPGLYQFNVTVPATATNGDNTLTASYGGQRTPAGTLLTVQ